MIKLKKTILLSAIQLSSMYASANEVDYNNYRDIHKYVENEAKGLMKQYSNTRPLDAEIFDSTDESIKGFIQGTSQSKVEHSLAMQYFPKLSVNGKDMSFCFLFYNSKKNIFQQYKNVGKMSDEEILQYLTWHEMGHCFAKHENFNINPKTNEFIADAFAISLAMNVQNNKLPTKVIKLVNSLNPNDIHANKPQLEKFFLSILDNNIFSKRLTVNEIIKLIRYFQEHSSLDGYK